MIILRPDTLPEEASRMFRSSALSDNTIALIDWEDDERKTMLLSQTMIG